MTDWPVDLRGVTETVVTTLGPNDLWNAAALGIHSDEHADVDSPSGSAGRADGVRSVSARTWGNTRTRRNFDRRGGGYVQFTRDPVLFVEAALSIHEVDDPVLDAADAWVEVEAERVDAGSDGGTDWEEWTLVPVDGGVKREVVPVTNRGYGATIEATVAASRLGVAAFDEAELRTRLDYFADVVDTCGGERERTAIERVAELSDWDR